MPGKLTLHSHGNPGSMTILYGMMNHMKESNNTSLIIQKIGEMIDFIDLGFLFEGLPSLAPDP